MDSFLRRIVAQRELEQEAEIVALPPETLRAKHCRGCDTPLSMSDTPGRDLARHFCTRCGGWRADARYERELATAAKRQAHRDSLLALVHIPPTLTPEPAMAEEKTSCPHCGKTLRSDNTKGVCAKCQRNGKGPEGPISQPSPRKAVSTSGLAQTRKKFRIVADALGIDGEQLLEQFMSGWLAKIRGSVRAPEEEDVL